MYQSSWYLGTSHTSRQHVWNNASESHCAVSWGSGRILSRLLPFFHGFYLYSWRTWIFPFKLFVGTGLIATKLNATISKYYTLSRLVCLVFAKLLFARWSTVRLRHNFNQDGVPNAIVLYCTWFGCLLLYLLYGIGPTLSSPVGSNCSFKNVRGLYTSWK